MPSMNLSLFAGPFVARLFSLPGGSMIEEAIGEERHSEEG